MHLAHSIDRAPAPQAETLVGLLRMALRRWKLILLVLLAVMGSALVYLRLAPKLYTAEALVMVTGTTGSLLKDIARPDGAYLPLEAVQTQVEALRAAAVSREVYVGLGPELLARLLPEGEDTPESDAARFDRFRSGIAIEQRGLSAVVAVAFTAADPALAAEIANRVADTGIGQARHRVSLEGDGLADVLDQRLAELSSRLEAERGAAETFRSEHDLYGTRNPEALARELTELSAVLAVAQGARADADAELAAAGDGSASPAVLASPAVQKLNESIVATEGALHDLEAVYGSDYPDVAAATATLGGLRDAMRAETGRILAAARQTAEAATLKEAAIRAAIEGIGRRLSEARRLERAAGQLDARAEATQRLYQGLLDGRAAQSVTADDRLFVPPVQLLSAALPPAEPSHPKPAIVMVLAACVSIVLAGIAVVLGGVAGPARQRAR